MLIYNAKIKTLDSRGTVCDNGFIAIGTSGKIGRIGSMDDCPPPGADDYDAQGKLCLPGFIDAHCHLGVFGNAVGVEGDDGNEISDPCTPHLRAIDMVNPLDYCFGEAAAAGVTTVMCGPGSSNPIAGSFLALKTAGSPRIDDRVIGGARGNCRAVKFAFGENPKNVYRERSESPVTRMATAAIIREQLYKAKRYLEAAENRSESDEPAEYDIKSEALLPLLRREVPMHAHCHRADDIFTAMRLAEEFSLRLVLVHATESAEIAREISRARVPVIVGPIICERSKPELAGLRLETAGILAQNGVEIAICTDHPVVPVQYLALSAGLAVRGGLSADAALRAITISAARICGIDDRVGSLEVGKDGDVAVFDESLGEFCDVRQVPAAVFVGGRGLRPLHPCRDSAPDPAQGFHP